MAGKIETPEEAEARMKAEQAAAAAGSGAGKAPKGKGRTGLYITIILLVVVAALVAVLGYLGRDVKKVVESSATQANAAATKADASATQANAAATKAEAAVTKADAAVTKADAAASQAKLYDDGAEWEADRAEQAANRASASAKGTAIAVAGKGARLGLCAVTAEKVIAEAKKSFATCQASAKKQDEGEARDAALAACKNQLDADTSVAKADVGICQVNLKLKATEDAAKLETVAAEVSRSKEAGKLVAATGAAGGAGAGASGSPVGLALATSATPLNYDELVIQACVEYLQQAGLRKGEEAEVCRQAKATLGL